MAKESKEYSPMELFDMTVKMTDRFWKRLMKLTHNNSHLGWMAVSQLQRLHIQLKMDEAKDEDPPGLINEDLGN